MTPETTVFVLTLGLAFLHILVISIIQPAVYGMRPLVGPRDQLPPSDNIHLGRARRANENLKETLPWALGLLLLVQITGDTGAATAAGAWLYLGARAVYLPLYLLGVPWLRTLAWFASLAGLGPLLAAVVG